MSSLNEDFKKVDLSNYIEANFNSKIENIGGNKARANPCPVCGHNNCFTIYSDGDNTYHCFSCLSSGTVADLMFATGQAANMKEVVDKLGLNTGLSVLKASPLNTSSTSVTSPATYFIDRGMSPEIIAKYGLKIEGNRALLPGGIIKDLTGGNYYNPKGQKPPILNIEYLKSPGIVYICEGVFDALSIETVGHKAISINSASNTEKFIEQLKELNAVCTIVSAFDNDPAGQKATEKLKAGCKELKIRYHSLNIPDKHKDVNEWLTCSMKELETAIAELMIEITSINVSRASCFDNFIASRQTCRKFISTGFNEFDRALGGGMVADTYIIGGTPGSGKSAFVLQMCQAISTAGIPVLYFSLELSEDEIDSRNASRLTYMKDKDSFLSALQINMGELNDKQRGLLANISTEYKQAFSNFYVDTFGKDRSVSYIAETAEWHKRITGKSPVVVVDYLQILQASSFRQTEKQIIDEAITELKRLSNSLKMPVIIVSSLNRASYNNSESMASYKESGSIEYSAAIAMNILPSELGQTQLKSRKKGGDTPCIETEIQIVKNRHYMPGKVTFQFYGAGNFFSEGKDYHNATRQK